MNGEPDLESNKIQIQQGWSRNLMLYNVLDNNGNLKEFKELTVVYGPIRMEYKV